MYDTKIIRTQTPFSRMVNFLKDSARSFSLIEIEPFFRFQIRFTAEDYNDNLSNEHRKVLEKHAEDHSMAPCQHYVYNYTAKMAFSVYKNVKEVIYDDYYRNDRVGEIIFFNPQEFPQLISNNVEKQHSHKFAV